MAFVLSCGSEVGGVNVPIQSAQSVVMICRVETDVKVLRCRTNRTGLFVDRDKMMLRDCALIHWLGLLGRRTS